MAVDERRRSELYERMTATIGPEATATMFDLLPPAGDHGATARDIDGLSDRMDGLSDRVDGLSDRVDGLSDRVDGLSDRVDNLSDRLDNLSDRVDRRFEQVDRRFEQVDRRFEQVDARFEQVDRRFDELDEKLDLRFDGLRNELLAAFRGELVTAVSGQTRALIVAVATAMFGIGGLALTLAQLL